MQLQFFNSRTGRLEEFRSLSETEVKLYVCGITPYDKSHLGHMFLFHTFDVLVRVLEETGYKVNYVQNATDIDEPMFRQGKVNKQGWHETAKKNVQLMMQDWEKLNIAKPSRYVYASQVIDEIITMISELLTKGLAYEIKGNVYFEARKFQDYGRIIGKTYEELLELAGGEFGGSDLTDPLKRDPLDFLLWRKSKSDEPNWIAPFGKGLPGWHIECSAIINKYLGSQIDIHGGGTDLLFPHHESEIAQSETFSGKSPFVNFWMHVGMVRYQGAKMSKSRGNLLYLEEILPRFTADEIRYYFLTKHYRDGFEFDLEKLEAAANELKEIKYDMVSVQGDLATEFIQILAKDLDTASAISYLKETADPKMKYTGLKFLGLRFADL